MADTRTRIESELEVNSYLQNLRYALSHNATITFQTERLVDQNRDLRYTNQFTVADLFPDENPVNALNTIIRVFAHMSYPPTSGTLVFSHCSVNM